MTLKLASMVFAASVGLYGSLLSVANAETLKIGVIAALTGGGAPWGIAAQEGIGAVAEEINAAGGLDVGGTNYTLEVIAYDDQYRAPDAIAAYTRLINQDGARYVFIMTSAPAMALKQSVEDDHVVALTTSFSPNVIDENTKYMFRAFATANEYFPSVVKWIHDNKTERRVVLMNPNDETGWTQAQITENAFKEGGFEVVSSELYERSQKDFAPLFTKVLSTDPELIDLGSTPPATMGLMIRQARDLGYKGRFLTSGGEGTTDILAAAGAEGAEGTISILYADPNSEGYKRISERYKAKIGQEPNPIIKIFYDAANVLVRAIEKSGDADDTSKVVAAFTEVLPMESIQGDTLNIGALDKQILDVRSIGEIKNGKMEIVGKAE